MADINEEVPQYESDDEDALEEDAKPTGGDEKGHIGTAANFKDFLLKPEILKAINESGFEHPSKVQEETIPMAVVGHDCVVQAKSGMGKTLVFVATVLNRLNLNDQKLQCVVIVHTRDMVTQIAKDFQKFAVHLPDVRVQKIVGGVDIRNQKAALKENCPQIVVATPGRLAALVQDNSIDLSSLRMFVIDEVDKVLEKMDMRQHVQQVFIKTPKAKQTLVLSATLADEMKKLVRRFVRDPKEILLEPDKLTLHGLKQFFVKLTSEQKNRKLIDLLDALQFNQVMIFVSSRPRADALNRILNENEFPAAVLHGGMSTDKRDQTYMSFKTGLDKRILVTTDVCARGIDIEKVNIVFNYDFPEPMPDDRKPQYTPEEIAADTYLHRVGRAGRFGNRGLAISFIETDTNQKVFDIVQSRFKVQIEELPEVIDPAAHMPRPGEREQFEE